MTNAHRHEWDWWRRADGVYYHEDGIICTICKTPIEDDDLIRRLNAVEYLSLWNAKNFVRFIVQDLRMDRPGLNLIALMLENYAKALEGDNDAVRVQEVQKLRLVGTKDNER